MKMFLIVIAAIIVILLNIGCDDNNANSEIDLTKLSDTMLMAEMYSIVRTPNKYEGKTITVNGSYSMYQNETTAHHFIVVKDVAACCAQGLEFISVNGNYPEVDTEIGLTGVFVEKRLEVKEIKVLSHT